MNFTKLTGMICAPYTPYKTNGEVNLDIIPDYAACLKENDIVGVFVNGSSGEGMLLTEEERMACAEAWAAETSDDFKLIIHVAASSAKSGRALAEHAEGLGAHAISAMAPAFPPVRQTDQALRYCAEIAGGAPNTPFYYYHIPALNGSSLSMTQFLSQVEQRIPTFAGIKFTSDDLYEFTRCHRRENGRFDILFGLDEIMLAALDLTGVQGFVGGTYNFCAPLYSAIRSAYEAGDREEARALQHASMDIIEVLIRYRGNMVAGKQMMRLVGLDLGETRAPFLSLSRAEFESMAAELRDTPFYTHCNTIGGQRAKPDSRAAK